MALLWQQICRWCAEFSLLAVQLAVMNLVYRQRRKRVPRYCAGFFFVYLCKTTVDVIWFAESLAGMRLYAVGVLAANFFNTPAFPFVNCSFIYCQEMLHTLIAIDRYIKFRYPTDQRFATNNLKRSMYGVFALALIANSPRLFGTMKVIEGSEGVVVLNTDKTTYTISIAISVFVAVSTTAISMCLELRCYFMFRRWAHTKRAGFLQEYWLLLYSMLQLVGQVLLMTSYLFSIAANVFASSPLSTYFVSYTTAAQPYLSDVFCLGSGIGLLIMCNDVRKEFARMYVLHRLFTTVAPVVNATSTRQSRGIR